MTVLRAFRPRTLPARPPLVGACAVLVMLMVTPNIAKAKVGRDFARHLLTRSGFSPTPSEVDAATTYADREALVDALISTASRPQTYPSPVFATERGVRPRDVPQSARPALRRARRQDVRALRTWWMDRMLNTPAPLAERMVLFWSNHFVSSAQKVKSPHALLAQHQTFRTHAFGQFGPLLRAMLNDPALLFYLDNQRNNRRAPNENLARELLELFTLGEGNYTERDIKESARALTGYGVARDDGAFRFRPRQHDDGEKTILGVTAHHDADSLADAILAQPRCATFLVEKLWREFVSATPNPREVARIAKRFRNRDFDIRVALRGLFLSDGFRKAQGQGNVIKSPIQLVVGASRVLAPNPARSEKAQWQLVRAAGDMGQLLFAPPNVRGWPGHKAWMNTATLHRRRAFLQNVHRTHLTQSRQTRAEDVLFIAPHRPFPADASAARRLHHALLDPAYQVH